MNLVTPTLLLLLLGARTTWDEPWQEDVVKGADAFLEIEVLTSEDHGARVTARCVEHLAGKEVPKELVLEGFSLLGITSLSDSGEVGYRLQPGQKYYVLVKAAKEGSTWSLPTPTAGWSLITDSGVRATYRHSYHQALIAPDLYERSMTAIFEHLHGKRHDAKFIDEMILRELSREPQDVSSDPEACATFFKQHVALECFYYFGKPEQAPLLEAFLKHPGYHVQISAVRALSRIDTKEARERLFAFLTGEGAGFAKVMAVWGLKRLDAREFRPRLEAFYPDAPTEETGFGGNIMDPRVGTSFPDSVKHAVGELIEQWGGTLPG